MRMAVMAVASAIVLSGCAGAGSKALNIDAYRTVDIHARNGRAVVQAFESTTGEKWMDQLHAFAERCLIPAFPEGSKVASGVQAAGQRTSYGFVVMKPGDDGKIQSLEDLYYDVSFQMGNNSIVVIERGRPEVQGVAGASAFTRGIANQLKGSLRPLNECEGV